MNFHKNPSSGIPVFHTDRRTNMTKLTVAFRNFANAPKSVCENYRAIGVLRSTSGRVNPAAGEGPDICCGPGMLNNVKTYAFKYPLYSPLVPGVRQLPVDRYKVTDVLVKCILLPAFVHQLLHFCSHIRWQDHRFAHFAVLHAARILVRVSGRHQHSPYTLLRASVLIIIPRGPCCWGLLHRTGLRCSF